MIPFALRLPTHSLHSRVLRQDIGTPTGFGSAGQSGFSFPQDSMNIFVLDTSPTRAAKFHCDKHVVKMVLESAQLLSTAHQVLDGDKAIEGIYKPTHINHPCAVWVRESSDNYDWVYRLFTALCEEYKKRYGRVHLTDTKMRHTLANFPKNLPTGPLTPFTQCMPDEHKTPGDAVTAYRNYYRQDKRAFAHWKNGAPSWWLAKDLADSAQSR